MAVLLALVGVLVVEALLAARGPREAFTGPPRAPRAFGEGGPRITYVVLGDSTGAGQGAPYTKGIAVGTARHLARARRVTLLSLIHI